MNLTSLRPILSLPEKPPKDPLNYWIVVAYYVPLSSWKLFKDFWLSEEAALKFAESLHPGYIRRRIFHLSEDVPQGAAPTADEASGR